MYEWFERAGHRNQNQPSSSVNVPHDKHLRLKINKDTFERHNNRLPCNIKLSYKICKTFFLLLDLKQLTFEQFSDLLVPMITGQCTDHRLIELFQILDSENDHYLDQEKLENLLAVIGRTESIYEIEDMISRITSNGMLNFQGFILFLSTFIFNAYFT